MLGADLADMTKLGRYNQGFKWLLLVTCLFSRLIVAAVPLKSKASTGVAEGFRALLTRLKMEKKHVELIATDQGKEFEGACKSVYTEFDVSHVNSHDTDQKISPTEKAISAVKTRLWKDMSQEESWSWVDKLQGTLSALNASFNRNLGMSPKQASLAKNRTKVFQNIHTLYNETNMRQIARRGYTFKFKIGDVVRIRTSESAFRKKYAGSWSTELYTVAGRNLMSYLPRYTLETFLTGAPIVGSFAESELRVYKPTEKELGKRRSVSRVTGRRRDPDNQLEIRLPARGWLPYETFLEE